MLIICSFSHFRWLKYTADMKEDFMNEDEWSYYGPVKYRKDGQRTYPKFIVCIHCGNDDQSQFNRYFSGVRCKVCKRTFSVIVHKRRSIVPFDPICGHCKNGIVPLKSVKLTNLNSEVTCIRCQEIIFEVPNCGNYIGYRKFGITIAQRKKKVEDCGWF